MADVVGLAGSYAVRGWLDLLGAEVFQATRGRDAEVTGAMSAGGLPVVTLDAREFFVLGKHT